MSRVIVFNKPFHVLTQFTDTENRSNLSDYLKIPKVYPAGRLDYDSEGLLLLTDDDKLQQKIANPKHKMAKTYWVQVEGVPSEESLQALRKGLELKDGLTRPAKARLIDEPSIWPRTPPIRERQNKPTQWLEIIISEGRNRQVRRMTAAINHPTLRLIRAAIGPWQLEALQPGEWREHEVHSTEAESSEKTSYRTRSTTANRPTTNGSTKNRPTKSSYSKKAKSNTQSKRR